MSQYYAAGYDGSKWAGGLARSGLAPVLNHFLLRINARSAYHTSLQARAVVERHTDSVVDNGLKLNATPAADILGITPREAEQWATDVEAKFDHWARNKKATLAENMNFYQAQRLVGICQQRDGEYFIRFTYSARTDLLNPLQLGFIDPNQIYGIGYTSTYGMNQLINDGIKRDVNGKEVAYKVGLKQPDNTWRYVTIPAIGPRSKRRMMIHGYQPEYPGQGRGYPRLSHALQEFENITDFQSSEIKKAINQSSIFGWVKPSKENVASNPLAGIAHQGPVGPVGISAQATELAEANNVDPGDLVNYIPIQEATINQPGSVGVFNLTEGEEIKPFTNTSPVESYEAFVNTLAGHLSASLSIPLEVVLMKFSQNYSASRASLILFWRIAQIWRDEMASDFLNPVYENWLAGEIAAGRIQAPGWTDPRLREAWLKNNWVGAPMPNIDPQKTAKADQLYVEMGAQTLDRVAQNLNGTSGKSNRAKLQREKEELPAGWPWSKGNPETGEGAADMGEGGEGAADKGED
jgi:lambda family phage portal protein